LLPPTSMTASAIAFSPEIDIYLACCERNAQSITLERAIATFTLPNRPSAS
jgi:hypothetical protein